MLKHKTFVAARPIAFVCAVICMIAVSFPLSSQAVSAKAYALVDQPSGRVILSCNENARLPMASTTKIMTALIAVESHRLSETFTVTEEAIKVEGSSMGLKAGEKITLRELVYGLMLESGNDAANSIAFMLGGSTDKFASMMNKRARQLGFTNTHFCNPSGLDNKEHYTSALDLARLAAYAMKNKDFAQIAGTKKIRVSYDGIKNGRILYNHNRLLGCYDGALGVKTGFTKKSGRCLVSCAKRNGVELIAVTLSAHDDWDDHKMLLNSGFKLLKSTQLSCETQRFTANVVGGVGNTVATYYEKNVTAALKPGESGRMKQHVVLDSFYYAPVKKSQTLGYIVYTVDGTTVATADIRASQDIAAQRPAKKPPEFIEKLLKNISDIFSRLCC